MPLALPGNITLARRPSSLSVSTLPVPLSAPAVSATQAPEQGDEEDVEEGGKSKKRKAGAGGNGSTAGGSTTAPSGVVGAALPQDGASAVKEYRYSGEISQMVSD